MNINLLLQLLGLTPAGPTEIAGQARPPLRTSLDSTNQFLIKGQNPSTYAEAAKANLTRPPYIPSGKFGLNQFQYPLPIPMDLINQLMQAFSGPQG